MKNTFLKKLAQAFTGLSVLFFSTSVLAGGPLALCQNGQPFVWANGGADVPFNPDQGALGPLLDNAGATQAVTDAFQAWADVPTASITYQNTGQLPVDVDISNFAIYANPVAPDGDSAIVFDDTGEIFDALFGPGSGVLGFAGPEFIDTINCTIIEGVSFLNGPAIDSVDGLLNLMVHEFGHYSNLAHTVVNGQLFLGLGDSSGPGADNTFGFPAFPDGVEVIETMFPFLFGGIDQVARTPDADDRAMLTTLYPAANAATDTGSIAGTVTFGTNKVSGVNVIARNLNDPFGDAVSAITGDFATDNSQANTLSGTYTLNGLTPGESYAVYVDEILIEPGRFSKTPISPLPGPEEFYNGANESNDSTTDVVTEFTALVVNAGTSTSANIEFNLPAPGDPLPTGDDGSVEIPLPFDFCLAGKSYSSAFINGNGFITFGAADTGLTFVESAASMTNGLPRIAGLWDDLNPAAGGSVFYEQTNTTFSVTWDSVPEFPAEGSNTFTISLGMNSAECEADVDNDGARRSGYLRGADVRISYGATTALDGLSGISAGAFATSGFEEEIDLSAESRFGRKKISMKKEAAIYELFSDNDFDLSKRLFFKQVGKEYKDRFEKNNSLDRAAKIDLPFNSIDTHNRFTSFSPAAADIDFYQFKQPLLTGTTLVAEALTGQVDTVFGLFYCGPAVPDGNNGHCDPTTAQLVDANDDANGLLSNITHEVQQDGIYALGVTFCCDFDFDGIDPGQGEPFDFGRYVLDIFVIDGVLLPLIDETSIEVPLGFSLDYQGNSYNSVFVHDNGFIALGGPDPDFLNFLPTIDRFESGVPRIAPYWIDLDPGAGGLVVAGPTENGTKTISFIGVPEFSFFGDGGSNTFSVTLGDDGSIVMNYGDMTATDGIVGLAEGGGSASTAVDFSSASNWPANGSSHEEFSLFGTEFDLAGTSINFDP